MSNINLSLKYGQLSTMPASVTNGQFLVATDVQKAFVDVNGVRVPLSDIVTGNTAAQIQAITAANALPKIYVASDTLGLYWYDTTASEWKHVNDFATFDGSGNNIASTYETKSDAQTAYADLLARIGDASFDVEIVADFDHLPGQSQGPQVQPSTHTIYFVPANAIPTDPEHQYYDEWMWLITTPAQGETPAVGRWEHIGTTETNLTDYYTKTEANAITDAIYAALGIQAGDEEAVGFVTFDGRLDEIEAKIGATMDPSSTSGFVSIDGRLDSLETRATTTEGDVDEIEAKLGAYAASTDTGFVSVEDRFQSNEADLAEIHAEIGNLDSTATGYVDIATRISALESAGQDDAADITELQAKFGNYLASTATGFVSVEDRFAEIEAKFGAYADSTATGFQTVEARFTADETAIAGAEGDIDEIQAQLGSYPASTAQGFVSVADRFTADEADIAELQAKFGAYADSTASGFATVENRFQATEGDVDEIQAQFGAYPASTDTGFVSVAARFTADETAIAGAESEIDEIQAQLGAYAASTDTGFVSIESRFAEIEAKIGATMDPSTTTGFQSIDARLTAVESGSITQNEDDDNAEKPVLVSGDNAHSAVEYVPNVTVNAVTGGVTANQITLGEAVLTFNSTTGALEVNF